MWWEGRSACEKWTRRARGSVVLHAVHSATLELVVCVCAVLAVAGAAPVRGGVPTAVRAAGAARGRRAADEINTLCELTQRTEDAWWSSVRASTLYALWYVVGVVDTASVLGII